uniref:protein-histidine N-methyltransferase n=1 Tax=Caenorhabditis tropicalis TaxID=1561998 RepID=A0A1I7UHT0_9PELO
MGTSDITVHKYEGGFKIWECTIDLCDFIEENQSLFAGKSVLELGCGAALPSILTAIHGAQEVFAQDFNASVIEFFTLPNFEENPHSAVVQGEAMGWEEVPTKLEGRKFDFILSSETIYNEEDYQVLHDAVAATIKDDGVAYFAAKFFYFGVGGSVPAFIQFINDRGILIASEAKVIEASVPRRILEIRKKP